MIFKDIETPLLTTGGGITAVLNFLEGDVLHVLMGIAVSISVIILNIFKIRKMYKDEKDK
tara:strand:+ start:288 stop:467 length:180 start_codon:yes stop_codon:yes gene_type:complete